MLISGRADNLKKITRLGKTIMGENDALKDTTMAVEDIKGVKDVVGDSVNSLVIPKITIKMLEVV